MSAGRPSNLWQIYLVHEVYANVAKREGIPIIGMGGIRNSRDALEFVLAGATAVAIGTALFVDPNAPNQIASDLREYVAERGITAFRELIGRVQMGAEIVALQACLARGST